MSDVQFSVEIPGKAWQMLGVSVDDVKFWPIFNAWTMLGSQPSGDIPHVIPFTASCSFPLVSAISCPAPGLVETLSGGIFPICHFRVL